LTPPIRRAEKSGRLGIIDGVTTNLPDCQEVAIEDQIRRILRIVDGDISAESWRPKPASMIREGRGLAKITRTS